MDLETEALRMAVEEDESDPDDNLNQAYHTRHCMPVDEETSSQSIQGAESELAQLVCVQCSTYSFATDMNITHWLLVQHTLTPDIFIILFNKSHESFRE